MEIKVIPFVPQVTDVNPAGAAASELQTIINQMITEGWTFVSLSSLQTSVSATGCNSAQSQGKGPSTVNIQLLIFQK